MVQLSGTSTKHTNAFCSICWTPKASETQASLYGEKRRELQLWALPGAAVGRSGSRPRTLPLPRPAGMPEQVREHSTLGLSLGIPSWTCRATSQRPAFPGSRATPPPTIAQVGPWESSRVTRQRWTSLNVQKDRHERSRPR